MCGIVGVLGIGGDVGVGSEIWPAVQSLAHRGPDDSSVSSCGACSFGHTRLQIVGNTKQPLLDGGWMLTYNGEIYNWRELARELKIEASSDTQVILPAYRRWGIDCVKKFNGMFAFAIWDGEKLFLARDRCGMKPLYYARHNGRFYFASEIKAILKFLPTELDREGLHEYLTFQNFWTEHTLFRRIYQLSPATTLTVHLDGREVRGVYWTPPPTNVLYADSGTEELDHLLRQAVERQSVGNHKLGLYLSSGLDSGLILHYGSDIVETYTIDFEGVGEGKAAQEISRQWYTPNRLIKVDKLDLRGSIKKLVRYVEEPRVGQSYPNWFAAGLARGSDARVVFSGAGGDELFGGYTWRYPANFKFWSRLMPYDTVCKLAPSHRNMYQVFVNNVEHGSLELEFRTFLNGLLTVEDKVGMAMNIETRYPFLDNDVINYAFRLPYEKKVSPSGWGKMPLRKLAQKIGHPAASQKKVGFSAPDANWYPLESEYTRIYEILDKKVLDTVPRTRILSWSLFYLEHWLKEYLP